MIDFSFEQYREEMIENLTDFLKIKSVTEKAQPNMPYGKGIFDALMFIQSTSERCDLECVNLFGHMAYVDYGDGDETFGILTHLDIVPAGEGWTKDPFGGEVEDGKIYGRGAIDDKGPAIAALYAIKALNDNCVPVHKKVRLIFGTDEETGWRDMKFYKKHEKMPDIAISPDGEFPVINTEKGLVHLELKAMVTDEQKEGIRMVKLSAGQRPNVVPNSARCELAGDRDTIVQALTKYNETSKAKLRYEAKDEHIEVIAQGKSAHGSRPEDGINAAAEMVMFLNTLPLGAGDAENAVRALAEKIGLDTDGKKMGLDVSDELSGALTLNVGAVHADGKRVKAVIDIRYPVSYTKKFIVDTVKEHFEPQFKITVKHSLPPHHVSEKSELVTKLKQAYSEVTGEKAYCISIGGATYARAFKNAVTFGPLFPGKPSVEHGPDEYIEIDDMIKTAQIIANAIIKICTE